MHKHVHNFSFIEIELLYSSFDYKNVIRCFLLIGISFITVFTFFVRIIIFASFIVMFSELIYVYIKNINVIKLADRNARNQLLLLLFFTSK